MAPIVYIVHCIDTEGPLRETLEQTFERIEQIFGISLPPSRETLEKLQRKEIDLDGIEGDVASVVRPELLDYNDSWAKISSMLSRITSPAFREEFTDDDGQGWIYNWFCCDHIGHVSNPRQRAEGLHTIFDFYRDRFGANCKDGIQFHYHPEALNRRANSNATHWFANTTKLFDILSARVLDRGWFPSVNRPGFHTERPDSHWFLEQFLPFDYANQSIRAEQGGEQPDLASGRFGDWRRAPKSWRPYHPSHDDYQTPGRCRRHIFRCLNIGTRFRCLTESDVEDAVIEAEKEGVAVLAFTNHDFRDMGRDVADVWQMINAVRSSYPNVKFIHSEAKNAAQKVLGLTDVGAPRLQIGITDDRIDIESQSDIFGPQPFLAIEARDGRQFHDAMDIHQPFRRWSYTFDDQTLPFESVAKFGIAAVAPCGSVNVTVQDLTTNTRRENFC